MGEEGLKDPLSDARVLVIVVTHNSARHIGRLLVSIPPAIGDLPADVVVVDNGSTDDTRELVGVVDGVQLVVSSNVGYAAAINRAVREFAHASAILVVNPDCELAAGLVAPLLEALSSPRTGIVVPRILDEDGRLVHSLRREPTVLRAIGMNWTRLPVFSEYYGRDDEYDVFREVDWAMGAVMVFRREVWQLLRGWDESFFLYSEED